METKIILEDKKLYKLIEEKAVLLKEGREKTSGIKVLEEERRKIGIKIQKKKDKMFKITEKIETGEFEEITSFDLGKEDGVVEVNVIDIVEAFKETFKNRKLKVKSKK